MPVLPPHAKARTATEVIRRLRQAGHQAYLAGGSVRDILLGKTPKDYDVVTSAPPEIVEQLFNRTVPIGKRYGIILVLFQRHQFEIATFRGEGTYTDNRRPDSVFWSSAKYDAQRRDFTINGLFLDPLTGEIFDYVEGQRDLAARLIRFVGNPTERIKEDHLRILRAIRFKNTLGFQYDRPTYLALSQQAGLVGDISAERLCAELNLMLAGPHRADSLRELDQFGILKIILPELARLHGLPQPMEYHQEGDTFEHAIRAAAALPRRAPTFLIWATLLHDIGKVETLHYPAYPGDRIRFDSHAIAGAAISQSIGQRLHMPRSEVDTIAWLIEHHMYLKEIEQMRPAKQRRYLLDPRFKWLLELHRADASGTRPKDLSLYREVRRFYEKYLSLWKAEQKRGRPRPLLTGDDLQELGYQSGPRLGKILEEIETAQLENKVKTKTEALNLAKSLMNH